MEMNDQQFIRGFNGGYLLAKHEPGMLTELLKEISTRTTYIQGMTYGQREYDQEIMQDRLNELNGLKEKRRSEKDINRDT